MGRVNDRPTTLIDAVRLGLGNPLELPLFSGAIAGGLSLECLCLKQREPTVRIRASERCRLPLKPQILSRSNGKIYLIS